MAQARIVIADDHPALRQSLRELLECRPGFQVVGEAETGVQAVEQVKVLNPDVAVLDFRMPQMDGLEAAREIRSICPEVAIFIISLFDDDHLSQKARASGARGFFTKARVPRELAAAIEAAVSAHDGSPTKHGGASPDRHRRPSARRFRQAPSRRSVDASK